MPQRREKNAAFSFSVRDIFSFRGNVDGQLLLLTFVLLVIGLLMLYSASYAASYETYNGDSLKIVRKQAIFIGVGLVGLMIMSGVRPSFIKLMTWPIIAVVGAMLIIVFFVPPPTGKEEFHRWISFGGFTVQPSEFAKIALVILLAKYGTDYANLIRGNKYQRTRAMGSMILIGVTFAALILLENHISGAIIMLFITAMMMFLVGFKVYWFVGAGVGLTALFAYLCANADADYMPKKVRDRLLPYVDKTFGLKGARLQTHQSLIAIGSGGLLGRGFGESRQKYLYLPEPQNDFIFAIVCEELGFVGAALILALFAWFVYRIYLIGKKATDRFTKLLVMGIAGHIAFQVVLNILVVTDTIPNTGIGLPFFSSGGTAILTLLAEIGMVLSASRSNNKETVRVKRHVKR